MLLSIIFTTLIMPVQVHPLNLMQWQPPQAPMVAAAIATARIIGLPRIRPPSQMVYVNGYTMAPYIESIPARPSFGSL